GGAHCCLIATIFELGPHLAILDRINGRDGNVDFHRDDATGQWFVIIEDWTFRYFFATFAGSPACDLTLTWSRGRFRPTDVRRSPRSPTTLRNLAAAIRQSDAWRGRRPREDAIIEPYDTQLISEMVDLSYTGNLRQALELLRLAWPLGEA